MTPVSDSATPKVPLNVPLNVMVAGVGLYVPPQTVTNAQLEQVLVISDEWITSRTGIRQRQILAPDQATSDMCIPAAHDALNAAGLGAADIDVIIVATYTWDHSLPSTAVIVKHHLEAQRALTFDINQAACANGLQAIFLAAHLLHVRTADTVLVVAADCASRLISPDDRLGRALFGDAASAVVLTRTSERDAGILGWDFSSTLSYAVHVEAGGSRHPTTAEDIAKGSHYLTMDGRAVWNMATRSLPESILAATGRAELTVGQVGHFFLHQANLNIIHAAMNTLGVPRQRAPITVDRLGNTGSAAVFTALYEGFSTQLVQPGDTYVLSAIGAGFQWGTLCLRHPGSSAP